MSRVVVATGYGGPENLSLVEAVLPEPGPGEVRLEVRAAGVNPIDAKVYSGRFGADPGRLPMRLGSEAAGVVRAVGPDAVGPTGPVRVGDEVIAFRVSGAYADELVVPASALVPKPAELSWEQAAGLMLTGATAIHALTVVRPDRGETLLVHGAAGGVGLVAGQVAVARGVRVVGTAAPANHELLHGLGVLPVAYGPGTADRVRLAAPEGIAAAIDTVGTREAIAVSVELVDRSRIVTIASFDHGAEQGVLRIGGGPGADPGTAIRDAARPELVRLVQDGALRVLVAATFPLEKVADAHAALTTRQPVAHLDAASGGRPSGGHPGDRRAGDPARTRAAALARRRPAVDLPRAEPGGLDHDLRGDLAERRRPAGRRAVEPVGDGAVAQLRLLPSAGRADVQHLRIDPRWPAPFTVGNLDLDHFRRVNETEGHAVGDDVLLAVGRRWTGMLPGGATLAHYGGGEFVVLLPELGTEAAGQVIESMRSSMPHLGTASAGLAEWRPEDTISLLLSRADASLYRAKRAGRNRIDPRVGLSVTIREMREALDTGAFVVLFQPIVDLTSGDTLAAEALVRWNHPLRGSINPADFIPLAEESGVIVELGRAVLEQACISVVDAEHAGRYLASITVNVAGRQLQQPDYAQEAFVRCTEPGRGAPIIASITALADALGLSTVAEGVEYPEQAVVLAAHGCHKGQGWLYGRPAFIDRLELPLVDGPLVEARSVDGPGGDTPSAATRRPGRPSEVRGPASR